MKTILKRIFNKNTLKIFWLIYALFSIVTIVLFADHLLTNDLDTESGKLNLNDGWNISINEKLYENVSLDSFRFDAVNKSSRIVMERPLPNSWNFEEPALTFHIRQSTVTMYAGDEIFYEYGHERRELGKTVGSGIQIINISNEHQGKTLRIVLDVTENLAFSSFDPVYITEWEDSYHFIITENRLPLFSGSFLVVFGIAVSLVCIFAVMSSRKYVSVLFLACFSIFMGLWTLCYHNIVIIFSIPLYSVSLLEYMALMMAPLPIMGYMYSYVKQLNNHPSLLCYKILFGIQFFLSVITIILHSTDIAHSATLLPYSQILFMVHSGFFTYILLRKSKQNSSKYLLYTIGLIIILSCILYDLLIYTLNRYAGLQLYHIKGVSSLGIITFIGILILDLAQDITLNIMEEKEKALLIKRAYTDELTQINNRTFCSEYMTKLETDGNHNYSVITFDLNDLKKTNDTNGHTKGDLLIKSAASVISEAFSSSGVVGRMGGDEFIAILPTNDTAYIQKLISNFNDIIIKTNNANPDLNLSISYGYATSNEISEHKIEKVYQLADDRMYKHKQNYKHKKWRE